MPTLRRLVAIISAARAVSTKREQEVMQQLADALTGKQMQCISAQLTATLLLAAGRVDDAATLLPKQLATARTLTWSRQAPNLIVPSLMIAGTQALGSNHWPGSLLHQHFTSACEDKTINLDWPMKQPIDLFTREPYLEDVIQRALYQAAHDADPEARREWFDTAIKTAAQRIDNILDEKKGRSIPKPPTWQYSTPKQRCS